MNEIVWWIAKRPIAIEGPLVTLSQRPGLGVEVDWDLVREHRVRE